jgi:CBS domain-containing protein
VPDYPDLADRPVSDIMSRGVVAVRLDDPLVVVNEKFGDQKVRCLLVIDPDDQLVGIIDRAGLVPHLPQEGLCEGVAGVVEWAPES